MALILFAILVLCAQSSTQTSGEDVSTTPVKDANDLTLLPPGDPRACLEVARKTDYPLKRLSALPGIGWDNLLNVATGQVIAYNYTQCRMSEDGRYLLPDAIFTIPVKTSLVETFAEIYESWNNVTSITSKSINVDSGLKLRFGSISGSYSQEHTRIKRKQILDDSVATRVQLRYQRYKAKLQPGSPLHPVFRSRVYSIASDLHQNLSQSAYYKAQLLVRDYGTHVLTSVTAGAGLVKTDFLTRSYVASYSNDKRVITASASASFGQVFKFGSSFQQSTDVTVDAGYKTSMTHSYISTYGGPIFRPYNMSVSQWVDDVDNEMVPMDRAGDPLYFVITPELFPGLPVPLLDLLLENIREAIQQYYEMNTVRGCTRRGSPNFSFAANVDDGSCVDTAMNLTFGGVYQTCTISGSFLAANPCTGLSQVNPLTQGNSCPSGYKSIQLHTGTKLGQQESSRNCRRCGFLKRKRCCHDNYFQAKAHYTTYWCAADGPVPDRSGYLFGGIWSPSATNLMTKTKGCPPMFYALNILREHRICLSDDYELTEPHAVPFGGFTSCSMGNLLAFQSNGNAYLQQASNWPKRCPEGFSQHMAAVDDGCEIRYCIKTGALSGPYLPPIRRPPFSSKPETIKRADVFTMVNEDNSIQKGGMILSKAAYDRALEGKDPMVGFQTSPNGSNCGPFLPSTLIATITVIIHQVLTR